VFVGLRNPKTEKHHRANCEPFGFVAFLLPVLRPKRSLFVSDFLQILPRNSVNLNKGKFMSSFQIHGTLKNGKEAKTAKSCTKKKI
jgi:hypothetical protein